MTARALVLAAWLATLAGAAVGPPGARSAPPDDAPAEQPLRFHWVRAPADRMEDWPMGTTPYLPVQPDEFNRLLSAAKTPLEAAGASLGAGLMSAEYRARFDGANLVEGTAALEVSHGSDEPSLLTLAPCGLAVGGARWTAPQTGPAKLGSDGNGTLRVEVREPGTMELDWSLAGRLDAAGAVQFLLDVPRSLSNQLVLDLPDGWTPEVDRGVVNREPGTPEAPGPWRIVLGGNHRVSLRVAPETDAAELRTRNHVSQSTVYSFSLSGLQVAADLNLDIAGEPVDEIELAVDPRLKLVAAAYGGRDVSWSVLAADAQGRATRVLLELPEPLRGTGRVVKVEAVSPPAVGAEFELPGMVPQDVSWQQGDVTLVVPLPLVVEQLAAAGARHVKTSPLPAPKSGEAIRLQYFVPDAKVRLVLAVPESPLEVRTGLAVELSGGEAAAELTTAFRAADQERFQLTGTVASNWTVTSVEASGGTAEDSADGWGDWAVDDAGSGSKTLTVRLAKPLSPSRPMTLAIAARRTDLRPGEPLSVGDLVPVRFSQTAPVRVLMAVRAVEPYRLDLDGGDGPTRVDPEKLDAEDLALFSDPPRGVLFERDQGAGELRITLREQEPEYSAAIHVEALATEDSLVESYAIQCVPQSTRVDQLRVRFSPPRDGPLEWTLDNGNGKPAEAEREPAPTGDTGGPPNETWLVRLPRARSVPFEVRATRTTPRGDVEPVSLASLPEATDSSGTLAVRSEGKAAVRIDNRRLQPIPGPSVPPDRYAADRAVFRYDPALDADSRPGPAVEIAALPRASAPPRAWVWSAELETRYEPGGADRHTATYRVQNAGLAELGFSLPPGVTSEQIGSVWVDGVRATGRADFAPGRLAVPLPAGRRFAVVAIQLQTAGERVGPVGAASPQLPEPDVPVLSRHWAVWLPPGYRPLAGNARTARAKLQRPLGWSKRLLGPLGRSHDRAVFDPLAAEGWQAAVGVAPIQAEARRKAAQLLQQLGELPARTSDDGDSAGLDWGTLLGEPALQSVLADPTDHGGQIPLLVDAAAVARAGVDPRTPVRGAKGPSPSVRGMALLREAGLALFVHPDAFVLTGAVQAAALRDQWEPLRLKGAYAVHPGPLAEQIREAVAEPGRRGFVPVDVWRRRTTPPATPWVAASSGVDEPLDAAGWTAVLVELPEDGAGPVRVVPNGMFGTVGWAVFLLVFGITSWWAADRPVWLAAMLGGVAVVAMLVPAAWTPMASGGVLAVLSTIVYRLIRRGRPAEPSGNGSPSGSAARHGALQAGGLLVLLAAMLSDTAAWGQDAAEPPAGPLYRVFVPVDESQEPTGDAYYVPEPFLNELIRREARRSGEPEGWLLTSATYRGELAPQAATQRLVLGDFTAVFDVETYRPKSRVRIPMVRDEAGVVSDGATLDGRVVPLEWEPAGDAFSVEVAETGQHRLELGLSPEPRMEEDGFAELEMAIPPVATARLELAVGPDVPEVEVPTAAGPVRQVSDPSRVIAGLGPQRRLAVRWQAEPGTAAGHPAVDVAQLLWLKVRPGSVVLEGRFKLRVLEGRVNTIRLAADPRLRLQPIGGNGSEIKRAETTAGEPQIIRLELAEPADDEVSIETTMLLTGASGVGNLRFPRVEVLDARIAKSWGAVSVDPALVPPEVPEGLEAVDPSQFQTAWGEGDEPPASAVDLKSDEGLWQLALRPQTPQVIADETMAVLLAADVAQVQFDADLEVQPNDRLQYTVAAPPGLQVDGVGVVDESGDRPARWARTPDGRINVFLAERPAGRQRLSVRGHLPVSGARPVRVPLLRLLDAELGRSAVALYRKPGAAAVVRQAQGMVEAEPPPADEGALPCGRLLAFYHVEDWKKARITLKLSPNQPEVRASQMTVLRHEGEYWEAEADLRLSVSGGFLDGLTLTAPADWRGPYSVQSDVPAALQSNAGEGDVRLVLNFDRAVTEQSGECRVRVSAPLTPRTGEPVRVPQIRPEETDLIEHFVLLPGETEQGPVGWETQGLDAAGLPQQFAPDVHRRESFLAYRAPSSSFQATLEPERGASQVVLADVRVDWRPDGNCRGVATFDLETAGLRVCTLDIPPGCRIVQVTVAGLRCDEATSDEGQLQVPLVAGDYPQRIEVVFAGTLPEKDSAGRLTLAAPFIRGVPVRQTLWTVRGPATLATTSNSAVRPVSGLVQQRIRLESLAELIQRAEGFVAEDRRQILDWYEPWARRWATLDRSLRAATRSTLSRQEADAALAQCEDLRQRQEALAERLGARQLLEKWSETKPVAYEAGQLWTTTLGGPEPTSHWSTPGAAAAVTLAGETGGGLPILGRVAAALLVAAMAGLMLFATVRGVLGSVFARWPHLLGVCVGVAWWLWLWPSILGWVIVVVVLASLARPAWRQPRKTPSSVVTIRPS